MELLAPAYEWFCRDHGGLYASIMCLRRHINIRENVVAYIVQIGRYNLADLLTVQLKKIL
jgi:hypothetical protein